MMDFRTIIPIKKSQNPIDYNSQLLLLGSCFAENIGTKFDYYKFQAITNPFGIIFNPVSIEKLMERVVNKIEFTEKDIFFHNELWHCFEVHSELSAPNKQLFLSNLNKILDDTYATILNVSHCQITYGTSWVYRNVKSNEIVANCHKVPQKDFTKELLSVDVIGESIQNTINLIQKINSNCKFIFTISPVRHIKDGFIENSVSKSHLISALYATEHYKLNTDYFPSFEILMDELRDYRFYADDMLHPSQTTIDYIWLRFLKNYISEEHHATIEEVSSIQKALAHRPFNPNSEAHQKFLNSLNTKIFRLKEQFPHIRFLK